MKNILRFFFDKFLKNDKDLQEHCMVLASQPQVEDAIQGGSMSQGQESPQEQSFPRITKNPEKIPIISTRLLAALCAGLPRKFCLVAEGDSHRWQICEHRGLLSGCS